MESLLNVFVAAGNIVGLIVVGVILLLLVGFFFMLASWFKKVPQGKAIIRTGLGKTKVSFTGIYIVPVAHRLELMDIAVKKIEINRRASDGLICKDNMRADISVVFFVRVNKTEHDVLSVASMIGVDRASDQEALVDLFDAKFSEALKTAGKMFEFEDLYTQRQEFKDEIIKIIGTDLNGYSLEDAAIDYLEQTPKERLSADNILDVVGLEKIATITRERKVKINEQEREEEKAITRQNVDAREKILDMEKELAEAEEKQKLEIANIEARTTAEAEVVSQQELKRSEEARIRTEEDVKVAEENKDRQIIVAQKNKERTEAVEQERVIRDRDLEATDRERVVTLAEIAKEKAVEVEKKNIQEVIRERVTVERGVVEEEEKIKDTKEFAEAERHKGVEITKAEEEGQSTMIREEKVATAHKRAAEIKAEEELIVEVKGAEARKKSAELWAEQEVIEAEARFEASTKDAEAKKRLAEGVTAEEAASGLAEANVKTAMADAIEKEGTAEATVIGLKGTEEAKATGAMYTVEAEGTHAKAEAMKALDGVGKEHEEFKLRLNKEKEVELAGIQIQADIAAAQASVLKSGLENSKIEIVGGDSMFFDSMLKSITTARQTDQLINKSEVLTDVKETFFNDDKSFKENLAGFVDKFGVSSEDLRNLSATALLTKLSAQASGGDKGLLDGLLSKVEALGMGSQNAGKFLK
ncbi:flotillin family protein [Lentisphaera profundi]|uniref:Flotillin family protein n=1 Tax=Lentisphaera profundi TaxID=1658616 RepID=A0ABY7W2G5_9BACT|nr:flotillin family protein [Lentisphaera profundi]WDE99191.1 flotillin family protein [Lentisphaera profundi]